MIVIRSEPRAVWAQPLLFPSYGVTSQSESPQKQHNSETNPTKKDQEIEAKIPTYRIRDVHVSDHDDKLSLSLDLPGVKEQDISVIECDHELKIEATRKQNGKEVAKFQRSFLLEKNSIDIANIKANLLDGVLTIVVPKVVPTTVSVQTHSSEAPDESDGTRHFQFELPGVKPKDLAITVKGNQITLEGERKMGKSSTMIHRSWTMDGDRLEASKLEVYLLDGILTLVVPLKETVQASPRAFRVERGHESDKGNPTEEPSGNETAVKDEPAKDEQ